MVDGMIKHGIKGILLWLNQIKTIGGIGFFGKTGKDFIPLFYENQTSLGRQKEEIKICVEL